MHKAWAMMLLALLMLSFSACYDAEEIDAIIHISALGVERGVSDKWRLTLLFSTSDGGGSQSEGGVSAPEKGQVVSVDAPSFFTGIDMLNTALPRKIVFSHAEIIAFSEDLARSGLVAEFITPILRCSQIRHTARLFVVKGKVDQFMQGTQPFSGAPIAKDLKLLVSKSNSTDFSPDINLDRFDAGVRSSFSEGLAALTALNDFSSYQEEGKPWDSGFNTGGHYVAGELPRKGDVEHELMGTAVFRGDVMVGELDGDQTRYMLMLRGEFKRGLFTIQDPLVPDLIVPIDVRGTGTPKIKIDLSGDKPRIDCKVSLNVDLLAVQSRLKYEHPPLRPILLEAIHQTLQGGLENVIETCQGLGVDVFLFGVRAARNFWTINELEEYNWNGRFQEAEISIETEVEIRRTGRQIAL